MWQITDPRSTLKIVRKAPPRRSPLQARSLYDEHLKAAAKGDRPYDETTICLPPGLPRLMLVNKLFEILQRDKAIYIVHQDNCTPRRAYFNEKLPTDVDLLYLGYSVARWDGRALVIDSSGFREGTLLDDSGLPHTEGLKLTGTLRAGPGRQDAPHPLHHRGRAAMYREARTVAATYRLKPGAEIPEEVCSDSMKPPAPVKSGG